LFTNRKSPTSRVCSMLLEGMRNASISSARNTNQIISATAMDLVHSHSQRPNDFGGLAGAVAVSAVASGLGASALASLLMDQGLQSAMKILVSPRVRPLRLEAHTSLRPSGENTGKPSNSASVVT